MVTEMDRCRLVIYCKSELPAYGDVFERIARSPRGLPPITVPQRWFNLLFGQGISARRTDGRGE
jgi:hypothetical protein